MFCRKRVTKQYLKLITYKVDKGLGYIMKKKERDFLSKLKLLGILKKIKISERPHLLKYLNEDGVDILCECYKNIIFNDLKLKPKVKKNLRKNLIGKEREIRLLANKRISNKRRKKVIIQQGGNPLGLILTTVIPILTDILFGFKRK